MKKHLPEVPISQILKTPSLCIETYKEKSKKHEFHWIYQFSRHIPEDLLRWAGDLTTCKCSNFWGTGHSFSLPIPCRDAKWTYRIPAQLVTSFYCAYIDLCLGVYSVIHLEVCMQEYIRLYEPSISLTTSVRKHLSIGVHTNIVLRFGEIDFYLGMGL